MSNSAADLQVPEVLPLAPESDQADDRPRLAQSPGLVRRTWRAIGSILEWMIGFAALFVGLAVLAALPLLQFLSLGYLLESGARVARTGKLRAGFIGIRKAARIGTVCLGTWLVLLPARYLSNVALAAEVIEPGGELASKWRFGLFIAIALTFLHVVSAWARGGRLRDFAWPFSFVWLLRRLFRGGFYREARDAVWQRVAGLRLPYYFSLGMRGFFGALAWLALPITLLACSRNQSPAATFFGFVGGILLAFVLLYLPFLQLRLATENRFRAAFELRQVRRQFPCAPWAFAFSLLITASLRSTTLLAEDRSRSAGGCVAAESDFHPVYFPGAAGDGLGHGTGSASGEAKALVLPLDGPAAAAAPGFDLLGDCVLYAIHKLEWCLEPLRTACLSGPGAVLRAVRNRLFRSSQFLEQSGTKQHGTPIVIRPLPR